MPRLQNYTTKVPPFLAWPPETQQKMSVQVTEFDNPQKAKV